MKNSMIGRDPGGEIIEDGRELKNSMIGRDPGGETVEDGGELILRLIDGEEA